MCFGISWMCGGCVTFVCALFFFFGCFVVGFLFCLAELFSKYNSKGRIDMNFGSWCCYRCRRPFRHRLGNLLPNTHTPIRGHSIFAVAHYTFSSRSSSPKAHSVVGSEAVGHRQAEVCWISDSNSRHIFRECYTQKPQLSHRWRIFRSIMNGFSAEIVPSIADSAKRKIEWLIILLGDSFKL